MAINDTIKRILGRQLSQEDIEKAKKGFKQSSNRLSKEYSIDKDVNSGEENIVIRTDNKTFMVTPDVSYGMKNPHMGYYDWKNKTEIYTMEGLLKEKSVNKGNFSQPLFGYSMTFNPAGKILGKIQNFKFYGK
jgi:hypothetical protein